MSWNYKPLLPILVPHFGCHFEESDASAYLKPSMNPLQTLLLILVALLQALPAQALGPLASGGGAVCEKFCCAALADEGLDACACNLGCEAPGSEVPALPAAMRKSEQIAAVLAADDSVLWPIAEMRGKEGRPASLVRRRPHLPGVRLTVLFCSFLN